MVTMLLYLLLFLLVFIGLFFAIYQYFKQKISVSNPKNYPSSDNIAKINSSQKVVVCLGDSNTHGNVSYDWVLDLQNELPDYQIFNAGKNADLTYTLLTRLHEVVACNPDFVSILIGTNDVNFTLSPDAAQHYRDSEKIARNETPDFEGFQANLIEIIEILKTKTNAKIAVASLPVMSEDLTHEANNRAQKYSDCIKQIAENQNIAYLPIREQQIDFIEKARLKNPNLKPKSSYEKTFWLVTMAGIKHNFGKSWDEIAAENGHFLSTDNLHQNKTAGTMIKNLVKTFILE